MGLLLVAGSLGPKLGGTGVWAKPFRRDRGFGGTTSGMFFVEGYGGGTPRPKRSRGGGVWGVERMCFRESWR